MLLLTILEGIVLVGLLLGSAVLILGSILTMDRHITREEPHDPPDGFCA